METMRSEERDAYGKLSVLSVYSPAGTDMALRVSTSKGHTHFSGVKITPSGFEHIMFQDYTKNVRNTIGRATPKTLNAEHDRVLREDLPAALKEFGAQYGLEIEV